jgi:hypothetical protein
MDASNVIVAALRGMIEPWRNRVQLKTAPNESFFECVLFFHFARDRDGGRAKLGDRRRRSKPARIYFKNLKVWARA